MIKYRGVKFRGCKSNQLMKNHSAASPSPCRARTGDHRGDGSCKALWQTAAQNHSWCLNTALATVRSFSCLRLTQVGTGHAMAAVISVVQSPQVLMWQEGCGSPGTALLSSAALRFPFLQEQPLPGCRLRPWGLRTAGSPAVGPASRLQLGGGFQQESGARSTLSQHPPDSSHFPPRSGLSLPDL